MMIINARPERSQAREKPIDAAPAVFRRGENFLPARMTSIRAYSVCPNAIVRVGRHDQAQTIAWIAMVISEIGSTMAVEPSSKYLSG
jgi:hypothetical protein